MANLLHRVLWPGIAAAWLAVQPAQAQGKVDAAAAGTVAAEPSTPTT